VPVAGQTTCPVVLAGNLSDSPAGRSAGAGRADLLDQQPWQVACPADLQAVYGRPAGLGRAAPYMPGDPSGPTGL